MKDRYYNVLLEDYEKALKKIERLEMKLQDLKNHCSAVEYDLKKFKEKYKQLEARIEELEKETAKLKYENKELEKYKDLTIELMHKNNIDGTNSGIPTSKTPINKKKVNPNSRVKTDKKVGGQEGHEVHKLKRNNNENITEIVEHKIEKCCNCGSSKLKLLKIINKDETDIEVKVVKRRHVFYVYKCEDCNEIIKSPIPLELKEENQYGPALKALILSLSTCENVPYNKIKSFIEGISNNELSPSEGYMVKLVKTSAKKLDNFVQQAKEYLLQRKLIYWDDTVVYVNGSRACLRFYGDEKVALYKAHSKKNKEGINEDGILNNLTSQTTVMHDHYKLNYNPVYTFLNVECNQHLLRELESITQDLPSRKWSAKAKKLINDYIHKRNELVKKEIYKFEESEVIYFFYSLAEILLEGKNENELDKISYTSKREKTLLERIETYTENYFRWVKDFSIPTTNNLSERSLRGAKSKMKSAGQFKNIDTASSYAIIKSYNETNKRNNNNSFGSLLQLTINQPFNLQQIINSN